MVDNKMGDENQS